MHNCIWSNDKLIEVKWHMQASVNDTIIGSDNGLSPVQHLAITWTHAHLMPLGHLENLI